MIPIQKYFICTIEIGFQREFTWLNTEEFELYHILSELQASLSFPLNKKRRKSTYRQFPSNRINYEWFMMFFPSSQNNMKIIALFRLHNIRFRSKGQRALGRVLKQIYKNKNHSESHTTKAINDRIYKIRVVHVVSSCCCCCPKEYSRRWTQMLIVFECCVAFAK